jgi:hypothetical protein
LGLTDAGKSALLGALARSAEFQEKQLGGRLTEPTLGLRTLRQTVYENRTMPASAELALYPLRFDTFGNGRNSASVSTDYVFVDPDGRRASELLGGVNGVAPRIGIESLGDYVSQADAVLLVVDASAPDAWIDAGFAECLTFLRKFRRQRGSNTNIAGLPVFLVLTKCDLLARPGDTAAIWAERMEARKEEATQRFSEFLHRNQEPGFGTFDFTPTATAIRQPALANSPARADEPYGVADLFRDVLIASRDHYQRRTHSSDRLRQLLLIVGTIAAFLIGFASIVTLQRTIWKPTPIVAALEAYKSDEGSPPLGHLHEPLGGKIEQLTLISRDPDFARLSSADQKFVTARLEELQKYQEYVARLKTMRLPTAARDLEELTATEKTLRDDLAVPAEYEAAWKTSPAVTRRDKLLREIAPLRAAAKNVVAAYDRQRQELDDLFVGKIRLPWPEWSERVAKALVGAEQPPVNPQEPIADWPVAHGEVGPTYAIPLGFLDMVREQQRLKASADRLATFRDVTQAVGLTPTTGTHLRLGNGFTIDQAPSLLSSLRTSFPASATWSTKVIPDFALAEVKQAARSCYEQLVPAARVALSQLPIESSDNPLMAMTQRAAGLANFKAWSELAQGLLKLTGDTQDPLAELENFAKLEIFPITIQEVALALPRDMPGGPFTPNGSWILYVQNPRGITMKRVLKLVEPIEVGQPFRFRADDVKPLTYRPGDSLWSEVPLRDNQGNDWVLGWVGFGQLGKRYQFDRLARAPRLYRLDEKPEAGKFILDAKLAFIPPTGVPIVPDLVPDSIKNK